MIPGAWKRDGEEGAALVEMAIVLPILVLLVFGIIEFGIAFNKRLTIGNATQSSARVATAVANNEYADISALRALEQGLISLPNNGIDVIKSVWIYKAAADGSPEAASGGPWERLRRHMHQRIRLLSMTTIPRSAIGTRVPIPIPLGRTTTSTISIGIPRIGTPPLGISMCLVFACTSPTSG